MSCKPKHNGKHVILDIMVIRQGEMKEMQNKIERHMIKIVFAVLGSAKILSTHLSIKCPCTFYSFIKSVVTYRKV
jgi:hypothetical protein